MTESCVSARKEEVKSEKIIWKESRMRKIIGIIMWQEMQWKVQSEVVQVLNQMKTEKVSGPSDVSLEPIAASGVVGIHMMVQ